MRVTCFMEERSPVTSTPMKRSCAKCRNPRNWTPAKAVNTSGVLWHWFRYADMAEGHTTALARRCMNQSVRRAKNGTWEVVDEHTDGRQVEE